MAARERVAGKIQTIDIEQIPNANVLYEVVKELRETSIGLNIAGVEILEKYISNLIQYIAMDEAYNIGGKTEESVKQKIEELQNNYIEKIKKYDKNGRAHV